MGQGRISLAALAVGSAMMLCGCGLADSHSPVPEFLRAKAAEPPAPEAPPDVKRLVRENLDSVFTAASHPSQVRVSLPVPDPHGRGWTACVRAELTSVTGNALGTQTYRLFISDGAISDRRHIDGADGCISEKYDPV